MGAVGDEIFATVKVNVGGAVGNLEQLSRKAQTTAATFTDTSRVTHAAGQKTADGVNIAALSASRASGAFGQVRSSLSQASQALGLFAVATGVVTAATAGLLSAADSASKLNEQVSASRQTFGAASKVSEDFSRTTASGLGIAASAALEATNRFGAFFKEQGFATDGAAKMSTTLVQLAGDLASFKNVSTDTALGAISSGLAGESEPLRRLGVDLRAAKVDAEALADGFARTASEITETDRIAARYVSILRQTRDAQGDAARTAGEYANTQRRFNATLEDFKATAGSAALPTLTNLVQGFTLLTAAATRGRAPLKEAGIGIGDVLTALGKSVPSGGNPLVFLHSIGEAGKGTGDKLAAAAKVYNDAIGQFGKESPQAQGKLADLRSEVDKAEKAAVASGQAFESTASHLSRLRAEAGAAASTLTGFVSATRGAEDATEKVNSSRRSLTEAETALADVRRKGKVDVQAVADGEQRVKDASQATGDARRTLGTEERRLADLRRRGPVDAKAVESTERAVADATRSTAAARRDLAAAEEEVARLRAGPTKREGADAADVLARAQLGLERAQQRQVEAANALGRSRGADTLGASLDLRDADLALAEATTALSDAQEAQLALAARGVDGSAQLRVAEDRAGEARLRVADATLRQSEAEAAERVARAGDPDYQQKIADLTNSVARAKGAVEAATRAEDKAATDLRIARAGDPTFEDRLARATQAVADAQRNAVRAQEDLPAAAANAKRAQEDLNAALGAGGSQADALARNLGLVAQRYRDLIGVITLAPTGAGAPSTSNVDAARILGIGRRAGGGSVARGNPYVVGELGPELFVPGSSGTIVPNSGSGAGSTTIVVKTILDGREIAETVTTHQRASGRNGGDVFNRSGSFNR